MEKTIIGALPIGTTLKNGKYTIEQTLGQGGMGITYLASMQQRLTGELGEFSEKVEVAIKEFYYKDDCCRESTTKNVVIPNTNYDAKVAQYKRSFIKEAKRIAGLSHPYIVHVLEIFEENNTVYYVMQYIRGGSIKEFIDSKGAITPDIAVKYTSQIASALEYMHKKKMCHYDLKPGNIMLSKEGNAMLIDFGIAKNYDNNGQETSTTPPGLTKGYAPLEQYTSVTEFSPQIDPYSLGATLYAMVTGQTPPEPMKWIASGFPNKPQNISDALWNTIQKMMSINAHERPTMGELPQMLISNDLSDSPQDETIYEDSKIDPVSNVNPKPIDREISPTNPNPKSNNYLFWILVVAISIFVGLGAFWLVSRISNKPTKTTETMKETSIFDSQGQVIMTFTGEVIDGCPQGRGVLKYLHDSIRDRYEGNIVKGQREDSAAVLYYKNGDVYRGAFEKDHFTIGSYFDKEKGEYFQGKFQDDLPWNGVWYDSKNNVICRVENGEEK